MRLVFEVLTGTARDDVVNTKYEDRGTVHVSCGGDSVFCIKFSHMTYVWSVKARFYAFLAKKDLKYTSYAKI